MTLSNQAFYPKPGLVWNALDVLRLAAAVLACSPPQQRSVKNTNACCLGMHKGKLKKESTLTDSDGFEIVPSRVVEAAHARMSTSNVSGVKSLKERRASEDHVEERGSEVQKVVAAPPAESERPEVKHGNLPDKVQLPGNTLGQSTRTKVPIFRNLLQRSNETPGDADFERELPAIRPVWDEHDLQNNKSLTI
ncbi:hypothetical protein NDU88_003764 [Pleurodeles waltl]|uniref:Uncharacterized protein n=1 Tax=Pleurodeles waltl TaxID=8319 RepID=A0AAV7WUJ1_PLEWA|nr:hypothetical protein NDU88_003764 [Pleurodeles waltl]